MTCFIERNCPICEKHIQTNRGVIPDINPENNSNKIDYIIIGS